jgi:hypothetical protein
LEAEEIFLLRVVCSMFTDEEEKENLHQEII